ncbi:MAG TPA: CDP-glucose 4,6-dehydratase [Pirellulaceae bacterium]|nr:CDP-glucose 4,6-dehydratase [Pirellulaceae bacterium]
MTSMFDGVFAGKSVLVTGHTGFKGSWLCLWLARLGAQVTGYAWDPPTDPNHFTQSRVADVLQHHYIADVRDTETVLRAIKSCKPDLVLHLAAQSIVRKGYREPWETFSTNVMGTASILEALRLRNEPCSAVLVTSDKCYENREQTWGYREIDAMGDHDPYGGSKGAAELVIRAYRDSFFPANHIQKHGIKIASARAGNVIGGGDWTPDALIVDVVKALATDQPVMIRSPEAFRPWQHVLQALSGYLTLAARLLSSDDPQYCSGWNIGPLPGNEIPVRDVVELFIQAWGSGSWIDVGDPHAPREAGILRLSIDKALWNLDWKPGWGVAETIRQTAEWYRAQQHRGEASMQDISINQIEEYESMLRNREFKQESIADASL